MPLKELFSYFFFQFTLSPFYKIFIQKQKQTIKQTTTTTTSKLATTTKSTKSTMTRCTTTHYTVLCFTINYSFHYHSVYLTCIGGTKVSKGCSVLVCIKGRHTMLKRNSKLDPNSVQNVFSITDCISYTERIINKTWSTTNDSILMLLHFIIPHDRFQIMNIKSVNHISYIIKMKAVWDGIMLPILDY